MKQPANRWEQLDKKSPFTVPEGYFDSLPERVMSRLPERTQAPRTISLWEKMKPWAYMAAMFAGIYLMINLFTNVSQQSKNDAKLNLNAAADIDDAAQYYQDDIAADLYSNAMYLAED